MIWPTCEDLLAKLDSAIDITGVGEAPRREQFFPGIGRHNEFAFGLLLDRGAGDEIRS